MSLIHDKLRGGSVAPVTVNPNPYPERTFFLGVRYDFGGPQKQQTAAGLGTPGSGLDLGDQSPTLHR